MSCDRRQPPSINEMAASLFSLQYMQACVTNYPKMCLLTRSMQQWVHLWDRLPPPPVKQARAQRKKERKKACQQRVRSYHGLSSSCNKLKSGWGWYWQRAHPWDGFPPLPATKYLESYSHVAFHGILLLLLLLFATKARMHMTAQHLRACTMMHACKCAHSGMAFIRMQLDT
eukprot:1140460-Pelagomonas_calceolata.AAC.2